MPFNPYEAVNSYLPFHQRVVLLSVLKIARYQKKKKIIYITDVYDNYIKLCEECGIEQVYKGRILEALKLIDLAGFIELKNAIKITKLNLGSYTIEDWEKVIYQDSEFAQFRNCPADSGRFR